MLVQKSSWKALKLFIRLQIDHIIPFAQGGTNYPDNLRLLCQQHNLREAIKDFGIDKIEGSKMGFATNAKNASITKKKGLSHDNPPFLYSIFIRFYAAAEALESTKSSTQL